jgi:hypothetical protein
MSNEEETHQHDTSKAGYIFQLALKTKVSCPSSFIHVSAHKETKQKEFTKIKEEPNNRLPDQTWRPRLNEEGSMLTAVTRILLGPRYYGYDLASWCRKPFNNHKQLAHSAHFPS